MIANVGKLDRTIRVLLGLLLVFLPLLNIPEIWSSAFIAITSIVIGAILIVTALVGVCPAYRLLGITTRRT